MDRLPEALRRLFIIPATKDNVLLILSNAAKNQNGRGMVTAVTIELPISVALAAGEREGPFWALNQI